MIRIDATEAERMDAEMLAFHVRSTPGFAVNLLRLMRNAAADRKVGDLAMDAEDLLTIAGVS